MEQLLTFSVPPVLTPCGEAINLRLDTVAMLRSGGVQFLILEACYKCGQRHELPLPNLKHTVMTAKPNITAGILTPNLINRN